MEMHDAWFFIGIFVFIFLIWIATGGPLHPIAFTGPSLAQPGVLGGGTYLQLPRSPYGLGSANVSLPGSSSGGSTQSNEPAPSSLGGSVFGPSSSYRSVVSLNHYVSGAGSSNPSNEYIELYVAQDAGTPVTISGWTLSSDATGSSITIPRGTEVPVSGTVNASQDIVITPGKRALLISGQSPIGASFRENKCIGYFSTFQQFSPSLPQNCPPPSDELSSYYGAGYIRDVACIDYTNKLSRCQVVLSPPTGVSVTCQNFLTQYLNYNGCLGAHQNDADFKGDTWRVYLNRTTSMWRTKYEIVRLTDATGKTVDAFSY
ncbi:MAG: hypothetical protein Q7R59_01895 [bacterium]|nr:hypothetical protein [bacterium]